jgi:hypothetical protein
MGRILGEGSSVGRTGRGARGACWGHAIMPDAGAQDMPFNNALLELLRAPIRIIPSLIVLVLSVSGTRTQR